MSKGDALASSKASASSSPYAQIPQHPLARSTKSTYLWLAKVDDISQPYKEYHNK